MEPDDAPIWEPFHDLVARQGADVCKKIDPGRHTIGAVYKGTGTIDEHEALEALSVHGEPRFDSTIRLIAAEAGVRASDPRTCSIVNTTWSASSAIGCNVASGCGLTIHATVITAATKTASAVAKNE